jgi:hypothetical protein
MSARRSHGVFETCAGHFRCFHLRDLCPTPRCCQNFGIRYAGRSRPTPRAAGAVLGVLCIAGRAGKRPLIQGGTRQGQPNHCPPISVCATQDRHAISAMGRSGAYLCGARARVLAALDMRAFLPRHRSVCATSRNPGRMLPSCHAIPSGSKTYQTQKARGAVISALSGALGLGEACGHRMSRRNGANRAFMCDALTVEVAAGPKLGNCFGTGLG